MEKLLFIFIISKRAIKWFWTCQLQHELGLMDKLKWNEIKLNKCAMKLMMISMNGKHRMKCIGSQHLQVSTVTMCIHTDNRHSSEMRSRVFAFSIASNYGKRCDCDCPEVIGSILPINAMRQWIRFWLIKIQVVCSFCFSKIGRQWFFSPSEFTHVYSIPHRAHI